MKIPHNTIKGLLIHILIIIVLIIAGMLVFFYSLLPGMTNHGETITVPQLEGIHMDDIDEYLTKRNLRYEVNDSTYSDEYPPLTILRQFPKAGSKVKENRKIFISVNRVEPPTVPVPELVDRSLINAEAVLKSNELKRGEIIYKPSQFLNLVLEIQIDGKKIEEGTRIPKGSTIDLVVGDGYAQSTFKAPNLLGYEYKDGRLIVLGSSLELGLITLAGDTVGAKSVIYKQDPPAGHLVKIGDVVDLWIAPESDSLEYDGEPAFSMEEEEEN